MSISANIVRISHVQSLLDDLAKLSKDPKLTAGESYIILEARDYLRDYEYDLRKKIKE